MVHTYLIIGTSAAGIACATTLRRLDPAGRIICLSDEQESPYNKCQLVDYFSGEQSIEKICTLSSSQAQAESIDLRCGVRVMRIDRARKRVMCADGTKLAYDSLFLATGSSPIIPPIAGVVDTLGCFSFHTLRDMHTIEAWLSRGSVARAVVIGGGLSGIEAADACAQRGLQVALVEKEQLLLPRQECESLSALLCTQMVDGGASVYTGVSVVEVMQNHAKSVRGVRLSDGRIITADMVIYAVGVCPNSQLARDAELVLHGHWVSVDNAMRTSDEHIWAGGDLVHVPLRQSGVNVPSGTWVDAVQQGIAAAHVMVGKQHSYAGALGIRTSQFFGCIFASAGSDQALSCTGDRSCRVEQTCVRHVTIKEGQLVSFGMLTVRQQDMGRYFAHVRRALITGDQVVPRSLF